MIKKIFPIVCLLLALAACTSHPSLPREYSEVDSLPTLTPDYVDVTIPCNIAPMNFMVDGADEVVAHVVFPGGECIYGSGNKVQMPQAEWEEMLHAARGGQLQVVVYARANGAWRRYRPFHMQVATDEIDPYITYRVLPPTFVGFEDLAIRERCLTNFDERDIYNSRMISTEAEGQCINCHAYQNYSTRNMQFHMRLLHGGTMIVCDGVPHVVDLKTDSMISAAAYPAWHPTEKIIAYSTDHTMQSFHTRDVTKVEVQETASDIVIYDVKRNEVQTVLNDSCELELFPSWSADGQWLYYCSAHWEYTNKYEDDVEMIQRYREVQYDLYRLSFDAATCTFGQPEKVYDAHGVNRSAVMPRADKSGRYLMFCEGPWGLFHVWHPTADVQILDLTSGELVNTSAMNSERAESYPSFNSTSRWILFESRRDDGNYTRLYFAYFDAEGRVHKAFELPQADPAFYAEYLRSMSRPEFMVESVSVTPQQFLKAAKGNRIKAKHAKRS